MRFGWLALLSVALLDELQSGGPMLGAYDLAETMGLTSVGLGWALLAGPLIAGVPLESLVLLVSDRIPRKPLLVLALVAMGATQLLVAAAPGPWVLAFTLTLWGTATGIATGVAEGALVAARPDDVDRTMTRWAFLGSLGDLGGPLLYGAVTALGYGWREALAVGATFAWVDALAILLGPPLAAPAEDEDDEEPMLRAIGEALRHPTLLGWLTATAACTLLDEIFIAFGSLYLRESGASAVEVPFRIAGFAVGAALGLAASERALARASTAAVILGSAASGAVALVLWISHPTGLLGGLAMVLLGACTAPQWALAQARAYATSGRPGLVAAVGNLFLPLEIGAALAVGAIADHLGLTAAMAFLLVQPLVVAGIALATWPRGQRS